MIIRPASLSDIPDIYKLQCSVYDGFYHESEESFRTKLAFNKKYSFVFFDRNDQLIAYIFAVPVAYDELPALNNDNFNPNIHPEILLIHDICVDKQYQDKGLGQVLLSHSMASAAHNKLFKVGLVSTPESIGYWKKRGFSIISVNSNPLQKAQLTYGSTAVYMEKILGSN